MGTIARKRVGVGMEQVALKREMVGLALEIRSETGLPSLVAVVDGAESRGQAVIVVIISAGR